MGGCLSADRSISEDETKTNQNEQIQLSAPGGNQGKHTVVPSASAFDDRPRIESEPWVNGPPGPVKLGYAKEWDGKNHKANPINTHQTARPIKKFYPNNNQNINQNNNQNNNQNSNQHNNQNGNQNNYRNGQNNYQQKKK
eukprot:142229_1